MGNDNALSENAQAALKASRAIQDRARDLGIVPTIPQMTDQKLQDLAEEAELRTAQFLWVYTGAWKALQKHIYQNHEAFVEYDRLKEALELAGEELRRAARASGDTSRWRRRTRTLRRGSAIA
ncbi:MAG: hypothetical protein M1343_10060 [Chloroflexi bacterium]|nr:hypothetical protein [Chloroflexota bacterium]